VTDDTTRRDRLALALHKTRPSNDVPEYDMEMARLRADRILRDFPSLFDDGALRAAAMEYAQGHDQPCPCVLCATLASPDSERPA